MYSIMLCKENPIRNTVTPLMVVNYGSVLAIALFSPDSIQAGMGLLHGAGSLVQVVEKQ